MKTVWVVGMEPLGEGPEASASPEACFATREAAVAWGEEHGRKTVGKTFWWGTVKDVASTYAIWEMQLKGTT